MTEGERVMAEWFDPTKEHDWNLVDRIDAAIAEAKRPLIEALSIIGTMPTYRGVVFTMHDIAHNALVADKKANP